MSDIVYWPDILSDVHSQKIVIVSGILFTMLSILVPFCCMCVLLQVIREGELLQQYHPPLLIMLCNSQNQLKCWNNMMIMGNHL